MKRIPRVFSILIPLFTDFNKDIKPISQASETDQIRVIAFQTFHELGPVLQVDHAGALAVVSRTDIIDWRRPRWAVGVRTLVE